MSHGTQMLFSFRVRLNRLAVYRVFATTLPLNFMPQSAALFQQNFHDGKGVSP
ncbi:hypothetical protein [Leptolyngbya sp. NIES-2104]|uniref:hypothetical protein n=1 Tax=Leptolyngbya sp. NIES-2104 TaxID=1552121 RepID=UPI00178CB7C4|nr:hypothetical protein [Leptolyngbya sp. NIES-2104]